MAQNEVEVGTTAPSMSQDTAAAAAAAIAESAGGTTTTGQNQQADIEAINTEQSTGGENNVPPATASTASGGDESMQADTANDEPALQATVPQADYTAAAPVEAAHQAPTTSTDSGAMEVQMGTSAMQEDNETVTLAVAGNVEQAAHDVVSEQPSLGANDDSATLSAPAANTFGQDILSLASSMASHTNPQEDDSTAAGVVTVDATDSSDAAGTATAVTLPAQPVESNGHVQQNDLSANGASATVPASDNEQEQSAAVEHAPDASTTHRADSDIEEGEELSSPPRRTSHLEQIPGERDSSSQYQRGSQRSISPGSTRALRSRDGRSRSPSRQRRPSPVRDGQPPKRVYNRDELFKVYIGGLPEKTELLDLQDCFSQFGEIGHIELKVGYAFIEFVTQEGAAEAIETYNEGHFLGKMIKVEASKSATTQQKSIDEGTCFTCGEHGHFAKYCPQDPRNANRGLRRAGRDRSPGRADRRDFRDRDNGRDRPYPPRGERDGGRRDRDGGRDDARSYRPRDRDDRREPDRRRDRDRDVGAINSGRYIEPHTRDTQRSLARSADPSALRERETLDQQRDRERQMRRLAEMDPNFVPPPPMPIAGYPPRGSMDNGAYPPPGALPPQAGSPYYPPYGAQAFPPPPGLPVGPYGIPPGIPGPSASPPIPPYPARGGESRMPYHNGGAPYPPSVPPYGRDSNSGPGEPYFRSGEGPPPFFYDRPPPGWAGPPGGPDRSHAGSPPFDNYGRPPPPHSFQPNAPSHEYDSYRPGR